MTQPDTDGACALSIAPRAWGRLSSCFSVRPRRWMHRGWSKAFSKVQERATRPPDRWAACSEARSAAWSACSPACLVSGKTGKPRPPRGTANSPVRQKEAKTAKGAKATKQAVLTQDGAPQLTAEQIVANSDANIDRIKAELNLTPEQEKHWTAFNSAMHYLGHNGADRLNLRIARAQRDPPDDIVEQMRNEAQFLNDRAVDQRNVADAAEPLFASLNDKQKPSSSRKWCGSVMSEGWTRRTNTTDAAELIGRCGRE